MTHYVGKFVALEKRFWQFSLELILEAGRQICRCLRTRFERRFVTRLSRVTFNNTHRVVRPISTIYCSAPITWQKL